MTIQNIQTMRTIPFIAILCCLFQVAQAQNQPIQPRLAVQDKIKVVGLSLKPELNFNGEPQQNYRAPQTRVILVNLRNTGRVAAGNFNVEVTYNWRVDHESFTAQTLKRSQTINGLSADQQTQIEFVVPDSLIRRNAPYGSPNVNISIKIDAAGVIAEMSESNNTASLSLPIFNQ